VVFDDLAAWDKKVIVHDRGFDVNPAAAHQRVTIRQGEATPLVLEVAEPLALEARHFVECIRHGARPLSDGHAGAAVVSVLECGQRSLELGREVSIPRPESASPVRKAA
jgi:predicted dehydrogenase